MAKGGGSQLSQLKAKLHSSGISDRRQQSKKSRQRKGGQDEKDVAAARRNKIDSIVSGLNPFDEKVTKPKHQVLGRKIKGAVGRPGASKASGLAQRRATLLPEWEARNRTGSFVDRRFGENDANMTPEEKMLERYATEKQRRSAKGAAFNLNDDDELLTHYGQSLSGLDDLADIRLPGQDDDDEDAGRMSGQGHFGGFDDDEAEEGGEKSKADVMRELIAKSKYHKLERQKIKDADEDLREQLDDELAGIRGLLFEQPAVPPPNSSSDTPNDKGKEKATSSIEPEKKPSTSTYDTFVRELAFERRAKPQDRLKSEAELAAEEAQRLMKAEKARLKRMRADDEDEDDDDDDDGATSSRRKRKKGSTASSKKRPAQGDDLEDDFELEGMTAGQVYGLGAGLAEDGAVDQSDEEDVGSSNSGDEEEDDNEEEEVDDGEDDDEAEEDEEDDYADLADMEDAIAIGEDEEVAEAGEQEALTGTSGPSNGRKAGTVGSASSTKNATGLGAVASKLPFTFACPSTHDEFLSTLAKHEIEPRYIPTVVKRIRTLHHASLAEDNKYKLQAFIGVLIDHVLHWAGIAQMQAANDDGIEEAKTQDERKMAFAIINALIPHIFSLSQTYPVASSQHFVGKLALMQRNLSRGLSKGALDPDSKTWPTLPELVLLRLTGTIFPTSDRRHAVTTPLALLIAQYLAHSRIRNLQDIESGLFLTTLIATNESESKRIFPEALNFLFNAIAILISLNADAEEHDGADEKTRKRKILKDFKNTAEEFGIPTPDLDSDHTHQLRLRRSLSSEEEDANEKGDSSIDLPTLLTRTYSTEGTSVERTKQALLSLSLTLLEEYMGLYSGSVSFLEMFSPFLVFSSFSSSSSVFTSLTTKLSLFASSRRFLRLQAHRSLSISLSTPKFATGYNPESKNSLDVDTQRIQQTKLRALIKKEKKSAIRELRKDSAFVAQLAHQKREQDGRENKKKVDKIMATLQTEQAEKNQLDRLKSRIKKRAGR